MAEYRVRDDESADDLDGYDGILPAEVDAIGPTKRSFALRFLSGNFRAEHCQDFYYRSFLLLLSRSARDDVKMIVSSRDITSVL